MELLQRTISEAALFADYVLREKHHQFVWPDNLSACGYHPQPIAVAVEGNAELRPFGFYHGNQIIEGFRICRVRVMVGKVSVNLAI